MFWLKKILPEKMLGTIMLRYFGLTKIQMLFFCRPKLVENNEKTVTISIALNRRTRNHLGSMYFGALAVGADCAAGLIAMNQIQNSGEKVALIFKSLSANFLKRVEGDVCFSCHQGVEITALVKQAIETKERVEMPVTVIATVPNISDEVVAEFVLVLSLKLR